MACIGCDSTGPMSQRPMANNAKICISCSEKVDAAWEISRAMWQLQGLGKKVSADDPLFQDPPPKEDCPICMLPMPHNSGICNVHTEYQSCCGKMICVGCAYAAIEEMNKGKLKRLCAFCRVPHPRSNKEKVKRLKKRMELNDAEAFFQLGNGYNYKLWGLARDTNKAFELFNKAVALGSVMAHDQIAKIIKNAYSDESDIEWDMDKAHKHFELAAMGGHEIARHNLGITEKMMGNKEREMKHYMMAASAGFEMSLKEVGEGFKAGHVSRDDYANTLRAYQKTRDEMKSPQRAKVAAKYPRKDQYV